MQGLDDLKVMRCIPGCNTPLKIAAHRDGMFIVECPKCGLEFGFDDKHPYFNHENAKTEIGDYVIFEAFKLPEKTHSCKKCGAPITKEQASITFEEQGRALCGECSG